MPIDYGELKLLDLIGDGGYGKVYKGTYNGDIVAIKVIPGNIVTNKTILNEARNLAKVNHEHIIKLYGTTYHEPYSYLILEFMAGGCLWNLLHKEKNINYELTDSVRWLTQAAEALAFLELIHRDVKPGNMLLDAERTNLKIGDFGTVRKVESVMTNQRGTFQYMAPEVFSGCEYTKKCDVYSMGITMWEVIVRKMPHYGIQLNHEFLKAIDEQNIRPSLTDLADAKCPTNIQTLIQKCWDKNPDIRPSMQEIVTELKKTDL